MDNWWARYAHSYDRFMPAMKTCRKFCQGIFQPACRKYHYQCATCSWEHITKWDPYRNFSAPYIGHSDTVNDCLYAKDENNCKHFACAGMLICKDSTRCVHPNEICYGTEHEHT